MRIIQSFTDSSNARAASGPDANSVTVPGTAMSANGNDPRFATAVRVRVPSPSSAPARSP
jgi:hypothetical protein